MFDNFKFPQLENLPQDKARKIISEAKNEAYKSGSYWAKNIVLFILAVLIGVFLMQLPKLLSMQHTVVGFLMQGASILVAVVLYGYLAKRVFLKYLIDRLDKH